jgi:hypothetical protein
MTAKKKNQSLREEKKCRDRINSVSTLWVCSIRQTIVILSNSYFVKNASTSTVLG